MNSNLKILLVQLYSNGDCLYATTIARQIKNDFPGCQLTWAVNPNCKNIILENPYIDSILVIDGVQRDDVKAFRVLKNKITKGFYGQFQKVFITQIEDVNLANYDGSIRSAIFRSYPAKITVPVQPVLVLTEIEKNRAKEFAEAHHLDAFEHVILFEFAPQSGQSKMTFLTAMSIAKKLTENKSIAIILSSANKIENDDKNIIDGSILSIRETAALTNYCNFMLGCSSGLTWLSTSTAAKMLPMVQMVDPSAYFLNPVSRDFKRFNINHPGLIELTQFDEDKIVESVQSSLIDFSVAYKNFNKEIPLTFKTSRKIVYNLLVNGEISAIVKHIAINLSTYGFHLDIFKETLIAFIQFPFKAIFNKLSKKYRKGVQ